MGRKEQLVGHLSPEVGRFVLRCLRQMEQENLCDAPSVINGLVARMRASESALIRRAAPQAERTMWEIFARQYGQRVGA